MGLVLYSIDAAELGMLIQHSCVCRPSLPDAGLSPERNTTVLAINNTAGNMQAMLFSIFMIIYYKFALVPLPDPAVC